jgi:hypothetical protein
METLLGDLALAKGDAQLNKLEHDGLQRYKGNTARSLGDDDIVKSLEGSGVLTDGDELYITGKRKDDDDEDCQKLSLFRCERVEW